MCLNDLMLRLYAYAVLQYMFMVFDLDSYAFTIFNNIYIILDISIVKMMCTWYWELMNQILHICAIKGIGLFHIVCYDKARNTINTGILLLGQCW